MFRFWKIYLLHKPRLYVYLLLDVLSQLCSLAEPYLLGLTVNVLAAKNVLGISLRTLVLCIFAIGVVAIVGSVLAYWTSLIYVDLQAHAGYQLNADTLEHVKRLPRKFFIGFDAGYYNQQINHDSNDLIIFGITSASNIIGGVATIICSLIMLMNINIAMAIACLACIVTGAVVYRLFSGLLFKRGFDFQEKTAAFYGTLQSQLESVSFLRRHSLFDFYSLRLQKAFDGLYPAILANQKAGSRFELANQLIFSFAQFCLLAIGGREIVAGKMPVGFLLTALSYYSSANSALVNLLSWGKSYQASKVSAQRLKRLWAMDEEANGSVRIGSPVSLVCKGLSICRPDTDRIIDYPELISLNRGVLYGVSGANGSGKSTLLDGIAGLYPDDCVGTIAYDEVDLSQIDSINLRSYVVGIAEQESDIVNGTLRENLTLLAGDNCPILEVGRLVDQFGLTKLVSTLPNGLDGVLDEQNHNISGGEKQKIAIIRVLLKDSPVMLFDEPTSALDGASRSAFIDILQQKKEDHIVVVVSHDPELLEACDEVIEL